MRRDLCGVMERAWCWGSRDLSHPYSTTCFLHDLSASRSNPVVGTSVPSLSPCTPTSPSATEIFYKNLTLFPFLKGINGLPLLLLAGLASSPWSPGPAASGPGSSLLLSAVLLLPRHTLCKAALMDIFQLLEHNKLSSDPSLFNSPSCHQRFT